MNPAIFIWIIRNLFNRNKSGRCAPNNCNDARSYVSKLTTSRHHHAYRLTSADLFLSCAVLFTDAEVPEDVAEDFVGGDFTNDGAEVVDGFADVLGGEVGW